MKFFSIQQVVVSAFVVLNWAGTISELSGQTHSTDQTPTAAEKENWSTDVFYEESMLVVTTDEGVIAICFDDPSLMGDESEFARFLVSYRWRYTNGTAPETSGKGELYAGIKSNEVTLSSQMIQAGSMCLRWSFADAEHGKLFFEPQRMQVQQIKKDWFSEYINPARLGLKTDPRPPVELERFLFQEKPAEGQAQRNAPGLHTRIRYQQHAIIVTTDEGIAVFRCDDHIDMYDGNENRYGTTYRYAVFPAGEKEWSSGTDDIWELYRDGKYNNNESKLDFIAGPIKLTWSRGGEESGWLYFSPEKTTVQLISIEQADSLLKEPELLQLFQSDLPDTK